jgi:hypothetical protein
MSDAAVDLLSDSARLEEMAQSARRTAQAKFCASRIIPLYERFYHSVVHAAPRPHPLPPATSAGSVG